MGSNTNRIPSADFAEAMRLLGIEADNPDRALVEVRIHEGCIDATYAQVRPLNIEYTSARGRIGAPEPTAAEEMEAFDQFEQAVASVSPNAQRVVNTSPTPEADPVREAQQRVEKAGRTLMEAIQALASVVVEAALPGQRLQRRIDALSPIAQQFIRDDLR